SSAIRRSLACPLAVRTITGIVASAGFDLTAFSTSKPLIPGSIRSRISSLGGAACSRPSAVSPSAAELTPKPSRCSMKLSDSTMCGSSSTISTLKESGPSGIDDRILFTIEAVAAHAQAAARSYGHHRRGRRQVQPVTVDGLVGVQRVADEHERHDAARCGEGGSRLFDGAGDDQQAVAGRELHQLAHYRSGYEEGLVDGPHRAGRSVARHGQLGQGKALAGEPGRIDAHQAEGDPGGAGPVQRDQAVADLLEARAEALCQVVDVVARLLGR